MTLRENRERASDRLETMVRGALNSEQPSARVRQSLLRAAAEHNRQAASQAPAWVESPAGAAPLLEVLYINLSRMRLMV
jgi:hypothetical protein